MRNDLLHPLGRVSRWGVILRFLRWNVGARILGEPCLMPFVNESKLVVSPGMRGATGNIYVGMAEFDDMAFALHTLDPNRIFLDIGANVGVYLVPATQVAATTPGVKRYVG